MAAEDLHPQAMYNLGLMYLEGSMHTPKDIHQGLQLISTAADFGLPEVKRQHHLVDKTVCSVYSRTGLD